MQAQKVLAPDALETNRAGRLTDTQRKNLRAMSRGLRKGELQFAVASTVMGLLIWFAPGPAKYANVKPLIGILFLVIAGALVVRAFLGADSLTQDARSGRVVSAEGAISKWVVADSRGSTAGSYFMQVGTTRVEAWLAGYEAAPDAGIVRIFYLPHSRRLINFEQLADHPLPAGALTDPVSVIRDAKRAFGGSIFEDPTKAAEARAEVAAIGHAVSAQFATGAVPPSPGARDPRPLAQAIVGTWKNMLMTVTFSSDGSIAATVGGHQQSGHWSVDETGHLVSDAMGGGETAADAWVTGNELTVTLDGRGFVLQRVG